MVGIDKPIAELMNLIRNIELETAHVNDEIKGKAGDKTLQSINNIYSGRGE